MKFVKFMDKFSAIISVVAMISLGCMAILTTVDVIMRWVFTKPITGATEYVQVFWIIAALSFGLTTMADEHTKVDLLTNKLPRPVRKVLNALTVLLCAVFCFIMTYCVMENAMYSKSYNIVYWQSNFPEWISMTAFAVSFFVMGLASLAMVIKEWVNDRPENDKPKTVEGKEETL